MKPEKLTIHELFQRERQYVVPLFQRTYVWNEEEQWAPLWEDVVRRAASHVSQMNVTHDGPERSHFLGAIVLNIQSTVGRSISKSDVIDGQQRLTTLQLLMAALRDQAVVLGAHEEEIDFFSRLTSNPNKGPDSEERFKVWPTNSDREDFEIIMSTGSPDAVRGRFQGEAVMPRMVQAYFYFCDAIEQFVTKDGAEQGSEALQNAFYGLMMALKASLQVVVIELEHGDDPQVIFETLNARGQPLLPSDLIRNFVFMRIGHEQANKLYQTYWSQFDEDRIEGADDEGESRFWHIEERQGRLTRPRIDLFIFHYLVSKTEDDIRIGHLFKEFRDWREDDGADNETFLKDLKANSVHFRKLIAPTGQSRIEVFAKRLRSLDTSTVYPLLLFLLGAEAEGMDGQELDQSVEYLESFMVRRFVCGLTPKNYNRFFLSLLSKVKRAWNEGTSVSETIFEELTRSVQDTAIWPSDDAFKFGWLYRQIYVASRPDRCSMVLKAIGERMTSNKNECLILNGPTTVEHLLPQRAEVEDYPFPEIEFEDDETPEEYRSRMIHTIGNLTLLTGPNNSSASRLPFKDKVPRIAGNSDLRLNAWLRTDPPESWDEISIVERGESLFEYALKIWPKASGEK